MWWTSRCITASTRAPLLTPSASPCAHLAKPWLRLGSSFDALAAMRPIIVASEPTPDMSGPRERLALEKVVSRMFMPSAERRPRIHFEVPLSRPSRVLLVCAANCGSSDPAVRTPSATMWPKERRAWSSVALCHSVRSLAMPWNAWRVTGSTWRSARLSWPCA